MDVTFVSAGLPWSGKNIWKMKYFPAQGNVGNFVDGHGNLEKTWKVREFENKCYGIYLFCSREERMYFLMR